MPKKDDKHIWKHFSLKQCLIFLNVFGLTLTEAETDLEEDQKKTKHFENHFSK
jgi:hypothetical protein